MRRPLIGLTLSVLVGLLSGAAAGVPPWIPLLAGLLAAVCAFIVPGRGRSGVYVAAAAAAWLLADLQARPPSPREVTALMQREGEHLDVMAVIADDPETERGGEEGVTIVRFPARVVSVRRAGTWQQSRGRVEVNWRRDADLPSPEYGDRLLLSGPARRLPSEPATAPRVRMDVAERDGIPLARGEGSSLRALCLRGRHACARLLALGIEDYPDTVGITRALMLGYRQEMSDRAEDTFRRTGTLHIIAISGAHVGMVALFFLVLLKATGCPQTRWILVLGPLLLLYALGTGLSASAVRACIMASAFWAAYLFRRQPDAPSALALAALIILVAAPGQLWEAGFLLSFVVVGGLIVLYPVLVRPLHALASRDPWQASPRGWAARAWRTGLRALGSLVAVTAAAWLVSTPLIASFFNLVSPVALLANLAVAPLAFAMLLAACLSVLTGALHPLGAEVFNHANHVLVALLLRVVEWFHRWPHGHWFVASPPAWEVALWLGCVAAMLVGRGAMRRAGAAVAALAIAALATRHLADRKVHLDTTPMGPVPVVFANMPGQHDWLIDTGPAWARQRLLRWLRSQGVDRIDVLLISRPTLRHGGGAIALLDQVPVREVWIPDVPSRSVAFNVLHDQLIARGVRVRRIALGDRGYLPGGVYWEVLHPSRGVNYASSDDAALALRLARGPSSAVYIGHAGEATEGDAWLGQDAGAAALIVASQDAKHLMGTDGLESSGVTGVVRPMPAERAGDSGLDEQRARLEATGIRVVDAPDDTIARVAFAAPWSGAREPLVRVCTLPRAR